MTSKPAEHGTQDRSGNERTHTGASLDVSYRPHRPEDMDWIVRRHGELYRASHGWDARFEEMVSSIAASFVRKYDPTVERSWIAELDGRPVGSVFLVRSSPEVAQLRLLFVEPKARGLGIGSYLVSACVRQARAVGYERMVLHTVRSLASARRLYEAEGFQLLEEEPTEEWGAKQMLQTWSLEL